MTDQGAKKPQYHLFCFFIFIFFLLLSMSATVLCIHSLLLSARANKNWLLFFIFQLFCSGVSMSEVVMKWMPLLHYLLPHNCWGFSVVAGVATCNTTAAVASGSFTTVDWTELIYLVVVARELSLVVLHIISVTWLPAAMESIYTANNHHGYHQAEYELLLDTLKLIWHNYVQETIVDVKVSWVLFFIFKICIYHSELWLLLLTLLLLLL